MNVTRVILLLLALIALAAILSVAFTHRQVSAGYLTIESPKKIFSVELNERPQTDGSRDLILSVSKLGQPFLKEIVYYHGTSLDGSFFRRYPERDWISESVLRFGQKNPTDTRDQLTVVNELSSPIRFLTVNSPADSFLILDFQPGAKIRLDAEAQSDTTADISGFSCLATLMDGSIRKGSVNFDIRGRYKGPAHYNIAVTESEVTIRRVEFDSIQ